MTGKHNAIRDCKGLNNVPAICPEVKRAMPFILLSSAVENHCDCKGFEDWVLFSALSVVAVFLTLF